MQVFYNWSGGMESSAMLVIDQERIREMDARVRFADTGKQFPELYQSKAQIEQILGLTIHTVERRIDFDTYLFERGGMIRKGTNDCSRRMKRANLSRDMNKFIRPYEVNLGFNALETDRADDFVDRNERDWLHWRFPLLEAHVDRLRSWDICIEAGFTVVVDMYRKMGRMDCFMCGNQKPEQALKVVDHYPELAAEWTAMEAKKGHSFMPVPLKVLVDNRNRNGIQACFGFSENKCGCFGGTDDATGEQDEA